jgi:hypothetical protein
VDASTAIDRIGRLAVHDLDWVEQPVPHWDVAGLARVRDAVTVRIAADQAVYTMPQLERVLEAAAADVVVQGRTTRAAFSRFGGSVDLRGARARRQPPRLRPERDQLPRSRAGHRGRSRT